MRGDLLFYRPANLIDRLICAWTRGPYCHVEVDQGNGVTAIGAHSSQGIHCYPIQWDRVGAVYMPGKDADRERGIRWLKTQVGKEYGWEDILNAVFKYAHLRIYLGQPDHFDCSDLATRYLIAARDLNLPDALAQEPHLVTPNDLARVLLQS